MSDNGMVELLLASEAKQDLDTLIASRAAALQGKFLAIIHVGDNPASATYVRMKKKYGESHGIEVRIFGQEEEQTHNSLLALIESLNTDKSCAGMMIQLPLPPALQPYATELCARIAPLKDVDGLGGQLLGLSTIGQQNIRPATPGGILTLLDHYGYGDLRRQTVLIIGQSNLLGKPLAIACINRGATVITTNKSTDPDTLRTYCLQADIICSCTGVIHLIGADHIRHDGSQVIIDAGYGHLDGKAVGDVDFEAVESHVRAITPVPGGVGPMTVAQLFANLIILATEDVHPTQRRSDVAPWFA
ncbi:MAG: bifunctional 5,10-methylenetetrahydrofolate dehydrogenase/5,10-methenyltetrahydrofolate cyclohydrolase [Candidatus Peribacteria bacterium]|nr:MAG: bifunctional 5,10-methylenetetrahydrofolate dehydrogenase/5,10-methenyltetrahydrofolate cyclohydrolase [Candidatus Peribacteria bacterium]